MVYRYDPAVQEEWAVLLGDRLAVPDHVLRAADRAEAVADSQANVESVAAVVAAAVMKELGLI